MSIATLKEELLRELSVAALGDITNHRSSMGAGTDLIDWMSGSPDVLRRAWVFNDKGPGLIRAHLKDGDRLWFSPGASFAPIASRWVVTAEVQDAIERGDVASFLENVLSGHVQDA